MNTHEAGIIDIQLYFPRNYLEQSELEEFDKVGKGKYTIGLGQTRMSFVNDLEDINSICLTVLDTLLTRNKINRNKVGRLEVGTETFLDKSKSIKTFLMELFPENKDIEGVTTSNACYGGTNALFNAFNWIQSSNYDGRYAIVIMADVAVYSKGNARCTGGCGAVGILLGPNANIFLDSVRSSYMNNVYDFYKPNPASEYPIVDGGFSIDCYMKALESCYKGYLNKLKEKEGINKNLNDFDYFCFHSPFAKMVEKAFFNLIAFDINLNQENISDQTENLNNKFYESVSQNKEFKELSEKLKGINTDFKKVLDVKNLATLKTLFDKNYKSQVLTGQTLSKQLGNIYTGSLYLGILSLLVNPEINLMNKKIFMFSYGSGCAATLFVLKVKSASYLDIRERNSDVLTRLSNRIKVNPVIYDEIMTNRENNYLKNKIVPQSNTNDLYEGTYFIDKIDEKWRRTYVKFEKSQKNQNKISFNKLCNRLNLGLRVPKF